MRDPITWSFPLGRMFGINVRAHLMLPLVMVALILRAANQKDAPPGLWLDATVMMLILFVSVLLHELGHCFAARGVDGEANDVLLWPLGGLAYCDVPHTPRAHLMTALGGPVVNLVLCVVAGSALAFAALVPPFNPFGGAPFRPALTHWRSNTVYYSPRTVRDLEAQAPPAKDVTKLADVTAEPRSAVRAATAPSLPTLATWQVLAAQVFWLNWVLLLLNLLPAYPLDGGRILQSILWWRTDYRQATSTACYAGFIVMLVMGVYAIFDESVLALALALFVYVSCKQHLIVLETGGEDAPFGYDFSQGYTSLEGDTPTPIRRRRPNVIQRWLQRRAARKAQREVEQREAEDRRMDALLEKVQKEGIQSLTDEERRFLTRVSARYRGGKS